MSAAGARSVRLALPVLAGPLRGARWIPASGGKLARLLLGSYEREQSALLARSVAAGDCVWDVGASTGYYALLASRLVGPRGRVLAFEPEPRNAAFLREHLRRNRAANVEPIEAAVGGAAGEQRFARRGSGRSRLDASGELSVRVVTLDAVLAAEATPPRVVKIDVEGAEADALAGADRLLREVRPLLLLSTHARAVHEACCERLRGLGYALEPLGGVPLAQAGELVCRPR